jgi:predicted Zn-dependent protease
MSKATGNRGGPDFLATHPGNETRIHDLEELVDTEAKPFFLKSQKAPNRELPISHLPKQFRE